MVVNISKLIFSCFESLLYLSTIFFVLPKKFRIKTKFYIIQFILISVSSYFFLKDDLLSVLLYFTIFIFVVFIINKVDLYVASLTIILTYALVLISSLISIIFSIYFFTSKYDFRYVIISGNYNIYIIKIITTVVVVYIYKKINILRNKKFFMHNINLKPILFANLIYIFLLLWFSSSLIQYLPSIYNDILKIKNLNNIIFIGIFTAYVLSVILIYIVNIFLYKNSDYINIKLSAETDAMTGVLNRKTGLDILNKKIEEINYKNGILTICYIDIDNLKFVNDKYGHKEGDKLIKVVSNIIKSSLRDKDNISRLGGDEFLVLFNNCSLMQSKNIWERISERIDNLNLKFNYEISVSVGFSEYIKEINLSSEQLIELADSEMYKNKETYKKMKGRKNYDRW